MLDSAQQAIGLINDLLDLSRLDEDRLRPVIRATEPGSMARRALARVTPAAEGKRVLLQLDVAPDLPSCDTDASRVEQILVNLLGNAINHAPEAEGDSRGSGLGLPLSRRLARLLGGELRAIASPGEGGCFILELPATRSVRE